ncbi:MAG: hypothetical protein JSV58_05730 [Candidatus Bathyarchaeota archaeon]|nr:MAG: hypothetical protein JSV58_05730 [Candidatus Bathyarchaeota archaeon]
MKKIATYHMAGYALGFAFVLVGLTMLIAIFWQAWPSVSTSRPIFPALEQYLWINDFDFGLGVRLKLMHLAIVGAAASVFGIVILGLSQKVFYVGKKVLLECPFCKNQWKASRARVWSTCPYCNQRVQPKAVKTRE